MKPNTTANKSLPPRLFVAEAVAARLRRRLWRVKKGRRWERLHNSQSGNSLIPKPYLLFHLLPSELLAASLVIQIRRRLATQP